MPQALSYLIVQTTEGNKCMWPRLKYVSILLSIFEYNDFNKNVYSNDEVISNNMILPNSLKSVAED